MGYSDLSFLMEEGGQLAVAVLTALLIGFLIGSERERRGKPVGILTSSLVCLGAMLFTHAGRFVGAGLQEGDAMRMAAAIVAGVGFVGAGAILRSEYNVTGLASAATVWCLGALGVLIGWGLPLVALLLGILLFLLLRGVPLLEHQLFQGRFCLHARLRVRSEAVPEVLRFLARHQVAVPAGAVLEEGELALIQLNECGHESKNWLLDILARRPDVLAIESSS